MKDLRLRKYERLAKKVMALSEKYREMPDAELQGQTAIFKQRLADGIKIEQLLPEAYAVMVEANHRVNGMRPYYVQILGAIALFFGNVAEMRTGEGKTLTATMPLYLHALRKKGNYLITTNAYLAWRDAEDVGKVFIWLGLTLGVGVAEDEAEDVVDRGNVYQCDVIYTTHSSLGFDYLFTNLTTEKEEQYVTDFNFVLIDEIDAILLDMAQTPLIVSGAPKVQSNLFTTSDWFVKSIELDVDFEMSEDRKSVWFTEQGIHRAEEYFGVHNILSEEWADLYRHLVLALKANYIMVIDRNYVVADDEVFLLDEANGRKLMGTKLQAGLHQAIEAKEEVTITDETKSMGTITYQNLFKKFTVLSGMTGTAKTDAEEFRSTYNVDVFPIPTNKPMIRTDHPDQVFVTNKSKILASLQAVKDALKKGRPVLIETGSVAMSNLYSLLLLEHRIPHNLLNATTVSKESWIISEAGKEGAITVATSMAGRGTDIKLEEKARENGGLLVVGTERMTSERIDNQLRGRAGRQGDPGDSVFFVSLEDKIVIESAPKWVSKTRKAITVADDVEAHQSLKKRKFKKIIAKSQGVRKNQEVSARKNTLEYDEIISIQREKIYGTRNKIIEADSRKLSKIIQACKKKAIGSYVQESQNLSLDRLTDYIFNNIDYNHDIEMVPATYDRVTVTAFLEKLIDKRSEEVYRSFVDDTQYIFYLRTVILKAIDLMWVEQADTLQQLKTVVSSRSWGQYKPLYEFQVEGRRSFFKMKDEIWLNVLRNYLLSELVPNRDGSIDIEFP